MSLKEVAAAIGLNYSRLSATRQKMDDVEFLAYLDAKSPHRWGFDRAKGQKGLFYRLAIEE